MQVTVDDKKKTMTIVVPLQEPQLSSSGKTKLIANTGGPKQTEAKYNGNTVTVNMSAWFKDAECTKSKRSRRDGDDD